MHDQLTGMDAQQLREFAVGLIERVAHQDQELRCKQLNIDELRHDGRSRRWKFAPACSCSSVKQAFLFDETVLADLEAIALGDRGAEAESGVAAEGAAEARAAATASAAS